MSIMTFTMRSDGGVCPTCPIMTYFAMNWYHMHVAYLSRCCCIVESVDVVVFDVALKCEVMMLMCDVCI